jgi:hypothetical protein
MFIWLTRWARAEAARTWHKHGFRRSVAGWSYGCADEPRRACGAMFSPDGHADSPQGRPWTCSLSVPTAIVPA